MTPYNTIHGCFIAVRILTRIFYGRRLLQSLLLFVADGVEFSTRFLPISSVVFSNPTFSAIFLSLNTLSNCHYSVVGIYCVIITQQRCTM